MHFLYTIGVSGSIIIAKAVVMLMQGTYEERLASYFAHQIRTDPTSVYGDGFKLALEAYQNSDLPTVIAHAERTGRFPG